MKIRCLFLFFILFCSSLLAFGQAKKVVVNKDTLITITERDLKKINSGIVELEHGKRLLAVKDSIIALDSIIIDAKDSIIENDLRQIVLKDSIIEQEKVIIDVKKEEIKKLKKKNVNGALIGGGIGAVIGALLVLLLK